MKLYNTLSRKIEEFSPINGKKVNLFVCGPTVYDFAHVGNAKTYTQFDFIVRYLRYRGYQVYYLQNITDIDDKIIKRALEKGETWKELAREYEKIYLEDMKSLGNTSVTKFARATDYIPQIVKQVQTLIAKGFAYKTSDGIYYDISKFKDYGKLSRRTEADREAGVSRIDEGLDKRNKNDFCLWKFYKDGDPFWEAPIGKGRPGWHIEDTAITETEFGPQYDAHGAAVDLMFPHHEAEIAQMEAASGRKPMVHYWLHAGFLNTGSEKMSKSRGNFWTIRDVLAKFNFRVLRFFFISSHYRASLDFNEESLEQARGGLKRIDEFVANIDRQYDDSENQSFVSKFREDFNANLDQDLDTPAAMATLFNFIREQNSRGKAGINVYQLFEELNEVFGFFQLREENLPPKIGELLNERNKLRKEGKFSESDAVRAEIKKMGYTLEDTPEGSRVKAK